MTKISIFLTLDRVYAIYHVKGHNNGIQNLQGLIGHDRSVFELFATIATPHFFSKVPHKRQCAPFHVGTMFKRAY